MSTASSNNFLFFETVLAHSVYIESENLLYIAVKSEPQPDLLNVRQNFEQTYQALGERIVKVTIDTRHIEFLKLPKEAMEYMSNNPYLKYQHSNALLIRGLAQKIIGNFYLNIMRPPVKTRLFTEPEAVLAWHGIQDRQAVTECVKQLLTSLS